MSRFVTVDAGTYFSTESLNVVDADTSHLEQSVGDWLQANSSGVGLSTTLTPFFGSSHGVVTANGAGTQMVKTEEPNKIQVTGSTQYTFSVYVAPDQTDRELRLYLVEKDASGSTIQTQASTYVVIAPGNLLPISLTVATQPLTAYIYLNIFMQKAGGGAPDSGDKLYWDAFCIRPGSDSTFMPSLEIVANDTYTKDPAGITAAVTAGVSLKVGDGWAGDAKTVTLQDGVGGPSVAKFDADDPSTVGDTDTWTDDTGRTWTMNGVGASIGYTERNPNKMATQGQLLRTGG